MHIGSSCTGRDLAGVAVGETSGKNVHGEDVNGTAGFKGYALVVAADLGDAWR